MRPSARVTVLALVLLSPAVSGQRQMTIPEAAARVSPGPLYKTRMAEVTHINVPKMVRAADLIIVCTVEEERVYLSDDQTELYTEFRATPTRVVKPRPAVPTPPAVPPILVRQWGGRTVIGGVQVNVIDSNLPPLPAGVPLVLFLKESPGKGVYDLVGGGDGAFSVRDGRVRAMRYPPSGAERFAEMPVATFVEELHRMNQEPASIR